MKNPSEKFMYDAVTPPRGPRTRMPRASRSAWYFHVPAAGSQVQRRVSDAPAGPAIEALVDAMGSSPAQLMLRQELRSFASRAQPFDRERGERAQADRQAPLVDEEPRAVVRRRAAQLALARRAAHAKEEAR